jgi:hypothetical protein
MISLQSSANRARLHACGNRPRAKRALPSCNYLPRAWIEHLLGRGRRGVLRDQRNGASERIRSVIMCSQREVDELLDQLRILLVPGLEELQLTAGIIRLQAFDAREFGPGMPDEFVRDRDPGGALTRAQHELEVRELRIRPGLAER